jgi:hypothetical protein
LNCDFGHNWMRLRRGGSKEVPEARFCPGERPYVTKLLFRKGLRREEGFLLFHRGPGAGTFRPAAGRAARDGFGQKNQSPRLFPTTEHVCLSACVPHVPSAAVTDTCAAAPPTESLRELLFRTISSKLRCAAATTLSDSS